MMMTEAQWRALACMALERAAANLEQFGVLVPVLMAEHADTAQVEMRAIIEAHPRDVVPALLARGAFSGWVFVADTWRTSSQLPNREDALMVALVVPALGLRTSWQQAYTRVNNNFTFHDVETDIQLAALWLFGPTR